MRKGGLSRFNGIRHYSRDDDNTTAAKNLINLRAATRLTQGELALLSGLSTMTIINIEGMRRTPREDTLERIGRVFGLSVEDLTQRQMDLADLE